MDSIEITTRDVFNDALKNQKLDKTKMLHADIANEAEQYAYAVESLISSELKEFLQHNDLTIVTRQLNELREALDNEPKNIEPTMLTLRETMYKLADALSSRPMPK